MSQELLYTSAPTGLKSGSRGFSTVLCTAGMASNISTRLETLSGYRHVFAPQDQQASLNPVSWSHLRLTINGQPTSILSRIAAYGVDYSGRTNKLAHHVVPSPTEMAQAGPAWLMLQSSWVRSDWDGSCQTPPSGPTLPSGSQPVAICQRWQQTTGDAGWGGVLAETIASPASKPLWIVFSIDQSTLLLSLINESIALMPISQRWRATFSTYYTNLPPEIDCKIRCVLIGTEEAKLAPARGTVIDLTKNLTPAPDSAYVETARTGVVMATVIAPTPASLGGTFRSATSSPLEVINSDDSWPDEFSLQPPAVLGKPPGLALANKPSLPPQLPGGSLNGGGDERRRRQVGWAIGISALAIILLLSAAIPAILAMKKHADGITELAANGTNGLSLNTETKDSVGNAERFKLNVNNPEAQAAADKIADDKIADDKIADDKIAADKIAADKIAADKIAADKIAADKIAADKIAADKIAADKIAADKIAADKIAADKVAADKVAATEKATADTTAAKNELVGWIDVEEYFTSGELRLCFSHQIDKQDAISFRWRLRNETEFSDLQELNGTQLEIPIISDQKQSVGKLTLVFNSVGGEKQSYLTLTKRGDISPTREVLSHLAKIKEAYELVLKLYENIREDRRSEVVSVTTAFSLSNFPSTIKSLRDACSAIAADSKSRQNELKNDKEKSDEETKIMDAAERILRLIDNDLNTNMRSIQSSKTLELGALVLFKKPAPTNDDTVPKRAERIAEFPISVKLNIKDKPCHP